MDSLEGLAYGRVNRPAGAPVPAIAVHGLRKRFGDKEAVAGIDLDIAAGSLAGLVGPNGAGKTTSLSMMTGLLRPDDGRVEVNGLNVWTDPPAAKAVMGVVPAEVRLFEGLSGAELLEYAGRLRGLPTDEARSRAAQLPDVRDLPGGAARGRRSGLRRRDPAAADPLRGLRFDCAVFQPCDGAGRAGLRPRVHHRQGQDRGHRDNRRGARRQELAARVHRPSRPARNRRGGAVVARLLVQLKLRLLLNALHSSRTARISFIVSTTFAVLLAIGTFLVLASFRGKSTSVDLTAVIFR